MKIPMEKMAEDFPECYDLSNQLYALICPVVEKHDGKFSNGHQFTQAYVEDIIDAIYLKILAQRGGP